MKCLDCEQAAHRKWTRYRAECPDCQVRRLSDMHQTEREKAFDAIEKEAGPQARKGIAALVRIEIARRMARLGHKPEGVKYG